MKISLDWLKDYIHIEESAENIAALLTRSGLEVEGVEAIEPIPGGLEGIVIGEVLTCQKHPDADKLSITTVDIGGNISPIVCGAPNVAAGQKVVVATVGATLYPTEGEPFKIKKAKIRGEVSEGMICAEDEIGIGKSHAGIMVLDTDLPNGTPAAQFFNLNTDYILEIGLTPNRADAASHLGVARDLRVLLNRELTLPSVSNFKVDSNSLPIEVIIENPEACPRYSGIAVSNVTVKESPEWLQRRLRNIGLSPINNIVDVTNYVLHSLGQPMHAFDADRITGHKIIVKNAQEGMVFKTLDGVERKLGANNLMIWNNEQPMAIAGVFGGEDSGVTNDTKNIFLESAYFSPDSVRKTAQQHGLKTDASFRYERGTDPNITVFALQLAAQLIKEIAGGNIASNIIDVYPNPVADFAVKARYKNIDRLIGKKLDRELIKNILKGLDIKINDETAEALDLTVPAYRVDVQREADIVEEIIRIYGYDNIEISQHLSASYLAEFPETDKDKTQDRIAAMLAADGFSEMVTNSLTKPGYTTLTNTLADGENVEILNKLSEDLGVMRQSLLFTGLEVLAYNINRRQKDLKLFEFGKVYRKIEGSYKENQKLALFITGDKHAESWLAKSEKADFHQLAGVIAKVLAKLNVPQVNMEKLSNDLFAYGLSYQLNKREIVAFGLLSPRITKAADVKQAVFYAELDWEYLFKKYHTRLSFEEVSKFPEVRRDLSLVLDKQVSFAEIKNLATQTERKLLKAVNVFDVYEGPNLGENKKSYSVSFILQDVQQTLTDQVIDKAMQRLMDVFEKQLGAIIRK